LSRSVVARAARPPPRRAMQRSHRGSGSTRAPRAEPVFQWPTPRCPWVRPGAGRLKTAFGCSARGPRPWRPPGRLRGPRQRGHHCAVRARRLLHW
jgi:hypothetical protein